MTWTNWGGTVTCAPTRIERPGTAEQVADLVTRAAGHGVSVKAIGSGHSFSPVAATDGVQVRMDRLTGVIERGQPADDGSVLVRVRAGTRLADLNLLLHGMGLAMPNLGDIDQQTISGALSTGTHGTGLRLPGLAAAIRGVQVVLADGTIRDVGPHDGELFQALRLGLGALGILTEVTLRTVPAFLLHAVERPDRLEAVLARVDELADTVDHFEFYWFPHTDRVLTKENRRVPAGTRPRPLPSWRKSLDDDLLSNRVFELTNRVAAARPRLTRPLNQVAARALSARDYTDDSFRVFITSRQVRFAETEWAMPREALPSALREVRAWIERSGVDIPFPLEARFAAADDIWLSTAYRRTSCYLAAHTYHRKQYPEYFAAVQDIALAHDGRPHWGKMHTLDAAALAAAYPRMSDFLAVREQVDPHRVFGNDHLSRVLGA